MSAPLVVLGLFLSKVDFVHCLQQRNILMCGQPHSSLTDALIDTSLFGVLWSVFKYVKVGDILVCMYDVRGVFSSIDPVLAINERHGGSYKSHPLYFFLCTSKQ